jgi:hypothetical protein
MAGVVLWRARREATKVPKKGHSEEKILRAVTWKLTLVVHALPSGCNIADFSLATIE